MDFVSHFRANKKCDLILVFYIPVGEKKRFIEKLFTLFTFEFNHLNTMH